MSSWWSRIGALVVVVLVAAVARAVYLLETYEDPAVDPRWAVSGSAEIPPGAVTVRWTGTATLVFSDGETTWMTDGWFSRPGPLDLLFGKIGPDVAAIEAGLARNEVERAAAVFPVHSHYDHAMDAPEVARRTGAMLLGSESTANIGRGWGLPEEQIRVVRDREPVRLGRFVLTPIASRHFEFPDPAARERALGDPDITEPLVPPVPAFDYKVGIPWVLHVAHPLGSFLVVGSAGFVERGLEGFEADVVFLGTGGIGSQTADYREHFWRETVGRVDPDRVIPIHWDSLTGPIEGPFTGPVRAASFLSGGSDEALAFLKDKERQNVRIGFLTLPRYDEVVLFPPRGAVSREAAGGRSHAPEGAGSSAAAGDGLEAVRGNDLGARIERLNTNPRVVRSSWQPRFPPRSPLREAESRMAERALENELISQSTIDARVDLTMKGFDHLPPDEQQRVREDVAREAAADAAIGEHLRRKKGLPPGEDLWPMLKPTVGPDFYLRVEEEMREGDSP